MGFPSEAANLPSLTVFFQGAVSTQDGEARRGSVRLLEGLRAGTDRRCVSLPEGVSTTPSPGEVIVLPS